MMGLAKFVVRLRVVKGEGAVIAQKVCSVICEDHLEPDPVEATVKRKGNLKNVENEEDEESKFLHEKKQAAI